MKVSGKQPQAAAIARNALRSPGKPLDAATRAFLEPRFGRQLSTTSLRAEGLRRHSKNYASSSDDAERQAEQLSESIVNTPPGTKPETRTRENPATRRDVDFSRIRIHDDTAAGVAARAMDADAFTFGQDIIFGAGQYSPATSGGRRLLAHEIAHTVQQANSGGVVQRQASGSESPITARTVFPYPEKSRILVNRLLTDEMMDTLAKLATGDPESSLSVRIFRAAEGQIATVASATDDLFEAIIPEINIPAQGTSPAQVARNVSLRFLRQADKKFRFELNAVISSGPIQLFAKGDLSASKSDGEVTLSPPSGPSAKISPGAKSGELDIVGDLGPIEIDALRLTKLPDAPAGSVAEKKAAQEITGAAEAKRREPRQEVTLGAGIKAGSKLDPVFTAAWRVNLTPIAKAGGIVQVPIRVQIDYAPDRTLLAGASGGIGLEAPTKIPVNVRITGGLAGGVIEGAAAGGGQRPPLRPAFGPTFGAGAGIGGKTFRVEVDYQHLQNLVRSSPNADTVVVSGGVRF
jgi:hypothetical protein